MDLCSGKMPQLIPRAKTTELTSCNYESSHALEPVICEPARLLFP